MRRSFADDDGATWTLLSYGLTAGQSVTTSVAAVSATDPATIWVGLSAGNPGVLRSTDGGVTWEVRAPPNIGTVSGIAIDPHDSRTVIVIGVGRAWVTTNAGDSWTNRAAGLPAQPFNALVYDGRRILVGTSVVFGTTPVSGVFASTNLGATWTPLHDASWPSRDVFGLAVDPANANTILAATYAGGIYRSTDGGATWTPVTGLPATSLSNVRLCQRREPASALFVAINRRIWRSDDAGVTWTEIGRTNALITPIACDPAGADLFVADNQRLARSTDGGATFDAYTTAIAPSFTVVDLVVRHANGDTQIYAASSTGAVGGPSGLRKTMKRCQ